MDEYTTRGNVVHNDPKSDFHPISFPNHIGGRLSCVRTQQCNPEDIIVSENTPFHHTFAKVYGKYSYTFSLFPILIFMNTS